MTDPLQLLNEKIDRLLKQHAALQAENSRLKNAAAKHLGEIGSLHARLSALEEELSAKRIGSAVKDEQERSQLRLQLDHVIGEIDKMLATLND